MVSAVHIYYDNDVEGRIRAVLRFLGCDAQPDILTVGKGSACDIDALRRAFPKCRAVEFVENEFEGYQKACELAAEWGEPLRVANDTLGLHWRLSHFRYAWLRTALAGAAGLTKPYVIVSERHVGRRHKFPGSGGPAAWYTSNYFLTNAPLDLGAAFAVARSRAQLIPPLFRSEGESGIRWLFGKRGITLDPVRIENKLRRTYIEMCLCPALMEAGIQVIWASNGRSVVNLAHKVFCDQ